MGYQPIHAIRSCRFSRLQRLHPHLSRRFVAPCCRSWGSARSGGSRSRARLHPSCLPFEALLLALQPYRVTAALLPSRRSCPSRLTASMSTRPQGLAPERSRDHPVDVAIPRESLAPLGFSLRAGSLPRAPLRSPLARRPPRSWASLPAPAPTGSTFTLGGWGR